MGLSETIVAAMIGAVATVGTALFQLLTAFRQARSKTDTRPKRGNTLRSVFAVMALMAASAAGGFLYSQLLREREAEDIRAMRVELRELRDLTAARLQDDRAETASVTPPPAELPSIIPASLDDTAGVAESMTYVPACRTGEGLECREADAQRIALCGTVPAGARVRAVQLFAQPDAVQRPWDQHGVELETDLGGARFTGKTFEYAQSQDLRAVCVNFMHWSGQHPHIARIVVEYESGDAGADVAQPMQPAVLTQTGIAESMQAAPQPASFNAPAAAIMAP